MSSPTSLEDPLKELFRPSDYPLFYIALIRKQNSITLDKLLKVYGINTNMWRVLSALHENGSLHISNLAELIAVDRSQLSRLLDQMENLDLVSRTVSAKDRRHTELKFTTKGRSTFDGVLPIVIQHYENVCDGLLQTEKRVLMNSLQKILKNFHSAYEH